MTLNWVRIMRMKVLVSGPIVAASFGEEKYA
jgi:hypothetical protein